MFEVASVQLTKKFPPKVEFFCPDSKITSNKASGVSLTNSLSLLVVWQYLKI